VRTLPEPAEVRALVQAAVTKRAPLEHEALRLVNGSADGLPRLLVERYGDALWVRGAPEWETHADAIREGLGSPEALFWRFGREAGGPEGDDGQRIITERGLTYGIELGANRNTGLFLDGRGARAWVGEHAAGRRILNLFSYTCGFGLAAAAGDARSTVNVDLAKGALDRGRANYARNGLPIDTRSFWKSEVDRALHQLAKGRGRFDGIVLDPPPIPVRVRGRRPEPAAQLRHLVRRSLRVLDPGGWLLMLSAASAADPIELANELELQVIWQGEDEPDCRPLAGSGFMRAVAVRAPDPDS
jgi:23S rRNA (cytosine1962-C5)-methyltransferase